MQLKPQSDGTWTVSFPEWSHDFFVSLISQLRDMLIDGNSDLLTRLYPTAYTQDAEANDAYKELVHDQLLASRLQALESLEESLTATTATEEQLVAWMQSMNSIRLVIGTRLDVSEDQDPSLIPDDHPDAPLWQMYDILSAFMSRIIDALGKAL